jgi:hypothetical protein
MFLASADIEVCFNRVFSGGHNPVFDAANTSIGPMYYYRNTITSVFNSSNLPGSEDTVYVEACVIQNTYGGIQIYSGDAPTAADNLTCDTDTEDDIIDSSGLLINRALVGTYGWEIADSEYYGAEPPTCETDSDLCASQSECELAGWNWCDGACQEAECGSPGSASLRLINSAILNGGVR